MPALALFHRPVGRNTPKMADLVANGAGQISDTKSGYLPRRPPPPDDIHWCDGLAVGSPINMGVPSWRMKRFWDEAMSPHWAEWTASRRARSRPRASGAVRPRSPAGSRGWCR